MPVFFIKIIILNIIIVMSENLLTQISSLKENKRAKKVSESMVVLSM